jgi:hypothetical protein
VKKVAMNGGRDRLTDEERAFVGVGTSRARASDGWHQQSDLGGLIGDRPSAEDSAMLAALMDADDAGGESSGSSDELSR